ncbi:thiol reductant ABC exporter subunit CydC [Methylocella sp.]|uniref:thiol reductant ABC exporter subunit CydC n=1 Tax=Methylocella sp. TaxID=1978226 RepID=UPI003784D64B
MNALWRLLKLYRPYAGWLALSIGASLVATLANIGLMATSGWFVTAMALAGAAGGLMNYFMPSALIRAFALLRIGGRYLDRVIGHEATLRLLATTRVFLFARLAPLAPGALADLRAGDLFAGLKGDVDRLELVFLRLVAPLATAALSSAAVVAALAAFTDLRLAGAVGAALFAGGFILPAAAAHAGRAASRGAAEKAGDLRASLAGDLGGLGALLLTGAAKTRFAALEETHDALLAQEARLAQLSGLADAGLALAGGFALCAALVVGVPLVSGGALGAPFLAMAALLSLAAFEAFAGAPAAFAALPGALASARRIFALADRRPPVADPARPREAPKTFDLSFEGVGLAYPDALEPALENIDLKIPEGARVAVVGTSGAGKSSLVDLLARVRDPSQGRIRLGGAPIDELPQERLRALVAVAPQAPHVFTATIAENLRLARPDATEAELREAAEAAQFLETVETSPQGFDTFVGVGGARLSGGQARRLAIARALLLKSPVLVLDEPGEGLDAETERALFDALLARPGVTLIVLTHRDAALARMDEIVVLEAGRIVERGGFEALATREGAFRRLFDRIG